MATQTINVSPHFSLVNRAFQWADIELEVTEDADGHIHLDVSGDDEMQVALGKLSTGILGMFLRATAGRWKEGDPLFPEIERLKRALTPADLEALGYTVTGPRSEFDWTEPQ